MHRTRSLEVHKYKAKSGGSFSFFKSNETLEILFRNVHLNFYKKRKKKESFKIQTILSTI